MDVLLGSPDHLAQLEEHLLLIRRIVSEPAPPVRRRGWLLEQCRRRGDDERELWRALARYRQIGAPGLLTADRPRGTIFGRRYIDHHTARCGRPASIFADDAKADIHRHVGGLPRLVNALCYRSILHAAANDTRSSAPPTSLPMTSSTDLSPVPSPGSTRHPSLALPSHPH